MELGIIKPINLNQFWYRRICEVSFLISVVIISLFFWSILEINPKLAESLKIDFLSVILASVSAIISFVAYLWPPKNNIFVPSLFVYLFLATSIGSLIFNNGGINSVFISVWMLISFFSGVFALWGVIPTALASSAFVVYCYTNNSLDFETITTMILGSFLPILVGAVVWHQTQHNKKPEEPKNYYALNSELNEFTSKSEVIVNAIGDGVMAIDSKGLIKLINPAAQELIGWNSQDSINISYKSVLQLVNQKNEQLDYSNDPIQQVLNTNQQVRTNSLTLISKAGKKLIVSLVVSPVGEMGSGAIAVFHDITAEKAAEREQAEFISTASHEMRTPVASIEGYLGLALSPQTAQIDARARDYILKAHASAQHLGRLFQDLLDVSKADDGRMTNNPKVVNIVSFVHDIAQGLQPKAIEKNLRLTFKPMPDDNALDKNIIPVFLVNLDNDHIREVMDNLIENAIKYTPKGEIVVDITGDDENIVVSIKDSGIGIPVEDMPHLFQKFYRVNNKDTQEIGGTGLGLYLSRRLVELMGGRIWAESVYGQGTTFFVELPRVNNQEAQKYIEQEKISSQAIASNHDEETYLEKNEPIKTPEQPVTNPVSQPQNITPNEVPRGQALSPEQKAELVAKQRALAAELSAQPAPPTSPNIVQPAAQAIHPQQPVTSQPTTTINQSNSQIEKK